MADSPILKNTETGNIIEVNTSPFSIGRSLICNFVIPSTVVSRKHCYLEKNEESEWFLHDTSTNGTFLNGVLIKATKSPPLKDRDIIGFSLENEHYSFHNTLNDDISDEQLCMIADSVLQYGEVITEEVITDPMENVITIPSVWSNSKGTNHAIDIDENTRRQIHDTSNPNDSLIIIENTESRANNENTESDTLNTTTVDLTNQSICSRSSVIIVENTGCTIGAGPSKSENDIHLPVAISEPPPPAPAQMAYDNNDEMEDEMQCSICSEMFVKATTLNCAHTFCKFCIETWKRNKSECPICRNKITSMTSTLVLDNVIDKLIQNSSEEVKERRKELLEDRQKEELKKQVPKTVPNKRGRGGRNRQNRGGATTYYAYVHNAIANAPNHQTVQPVDNRHIQGRVPGMGSAPAANPGHDSVIEVGSSSDSSDTLSDEQSEDWRDEYDNDAWYGDGIPGAYFGGYGHCFSCGSTGHWRNGCPYR